MILRNKEIKNFSKKDLEEKLSELKMELVKSNASANKTGKVKIKELKRTIARLITAINHTQ